MCVVGLTLNVANGANGAQKPFKVAVYKNKKKIGYFTPCDCFPNTAPQNLNPENTAQQFCIPCPAAPLSTTSINNGSPSYMSRTVFYSNLKKGCSSPGELTIVSGGQATAKYFVQFTNAPASKNVPYFKVGSKTYSKDLTLQGGDPLDVVCPNQVS